MAPVGTSRDVRAANRREIKKVVKTARPTKHRVPEKKWPIRSVKYWGKYAAGRYKNKHGFHCKFEGCGSQDTDLVFPESALPSSMKIYLKRAVKRGANAKTWLRIIGNSQLAMALCESSKSAVTVCEAPKGGSSHVVQYLGEVIHKAPVSVAVSESAATVCEASKEGSSHVGQHFEKTVPYTNINSWCVPDALLNVIGAPRETEQQLKAFIGSDRCDFSTMADGMSKIKKFKYAITKKFERTNTLEWVIRQADGQYLIEDNLHCVSVDCTKKLIFDNGRQNTLPITLENFHACGIAGFRNDGIRKVIKFV